jgi:hypothetical protein
MIYRLAALEAEQRLLLEQNSQLFADLEEARGTVKILKERLADDSA